MGSRLTEFSIRHPKGVTALMLLMTGVLAVLALAPSLWPDLVPGLEGIKVDTDPENMLSEDEPVRVFHNRMKKALSLYDIVVVGIVNERHPQGVFNPESLRNIFLLTQYARTLVGEAIGAEDPRSGVVEVDLIAPSMVDNIEQAGPGAVRFEWLMPKPPTTVEEAVAIRTKAARIPLLDGTMVSEDGRAICLYLPLTSKDVSYSVYRRLRERIATLEGDERYFITGLPVAEDTFGVEMFIQMAVSAPLAMLVIFLLMLYFFRQLTLIVSPMIVALVSVICTMGLLVATGNTIHIMSSMIPIFIMPIAVLDSIHILSAFFDRYQETRDRRMTIRAVMEALFVPMLYTSLTSGAGFASLALTPIPPVRVFGLFVACGILLAWLLTVTFIPAYIMLLPEKSFSNFGQRSTSDEEENASLLGRLLAWMGEITCRRAKLIIALSLLSFGFAVWGISLIRINDNPIKWFRSSHPIRIADQVLNNHFAGTYMAYLGLLPAGETSGGQGDELRESSQSPVPYTEPRLPAGLADKEEPLLPVGLSGAALEEEKPAVQVNDQKTEIFKQPEVLRYIEDLQRHLTTTGVVGKSSSLADIVKVVHRELIDGSDEQFRIPDSAAAVAQSLMQYQSSHRPNDIWHFVTPDYRTSSLWLQLKSGDNKEMERVVRAVEEFTRDNPPPAALEARWFGLTYINVVWQEKMVSGMSKAFLGSFVVVFAMMTLLFRSPLWGLLSMIPLTLSIALIYGVIGFIGKDYDMPVAVLSTLTLGLAIDFAIHFLARSRALHERYGSLRVALVHAFGEPARAIVRNVVVIAVGFTPLLAAPLIPYNTVGVLLASILLVSGLATLVILPATMQLLERFLFGTGTGQAAADKS